MIPARTSEDMGTDYGCASVAVPAVLILVVMIWAALAFHWGL